MKKIIYIGFLVFFAFGQFLHSQTLDEARELYKVGEFEKAMPVFKKELDAKPNDAALNQWYGVCLYEVQKKVKEAELYIQVAAKKNIPDAFLYLGMIYTDTYRFDKADAEFKKYGKLKRRDKTAMAKLEKEEERLSLIKRMAFRTEDIQLIDSVVVDKKDFLSTYKLTPASGHLSYFSQFFNKGTAGTTVYSNQKGTKIYYAKPVSEKKTSLFSMEKLMDDLGNEKRLSNDDFGLSGDLNYPFVLTDGVTVYFAAEDEDGMGGYDLYVTRYNMNNDTYLTPERLNAPFNSPFNDYMMAIDDEKGIGWFATDRFQPEGKVCVYTFIPNDQVEMVESEDAQYVINRAAVSSIKDSWKKDANYTKLVSLARKSVEEKPEMKKDFTFVVNDDYTYYSWAEFKNPNAKSLYQQAHDLSKELVTVTGRLNTLRDLYDTKPSQSNANEIIQLENKQSQLVQQIKDLEIKSRNQEISSLR